MVPSIISQVNMSTENFTVTKQPLVILTGPTAVGKTALSISLAKRINGEIISADSMQVYRGMDIGSAKIMPEEMDGVPHHLIDILDPDETFHVVLFQQLAKQAIGEVAGRGKIPILTGGTGFYIQAVLYDIDFTENDADTAYREALEERFSNGEGQALWEELRCVDPASAQAIHPNNHKRVIRALEFYQKTGSPISAHNAQERKKQSAYNSAYFVLTDVRERLYERIDARVDQMMQQGLLDEVRSLYGRGLDRSFVSMQGLGYKELIGYLEGDCSLDEAVYTIKRDSRHFAKPQLTWFRREKDVIWVDRSQLTDSAQVLAFMEQELSRRNII